LKAHNSSFGSIKSISVLLPGITGRRWQSGGLLIAQKLARLLNAHVPTRTVTYIDREISELYLDDILESSDPADVFIASWGPHVNDLTQRLKGRRLVYYAQSTGWSIQLPISVPIISLSRHIMAQWMLDAPHNPSFLLGPVLEPECYNHEVDRDIDVLFLERKSTKYLQHQLVPALRQKCKVHTVREFVSREELFNLYNRSRVYVYSSAPWASGWVEGFGFQPLEALMCGCAVFSNLHGGLADYLEPEMNAFKLESYSLQYDVARVLKVLEDGWTNSDSDVAGLRTEYSEEAFHRRVQRILPALNAFFPHAESSYADILRLIAEPKTPAWRLAVYRNRKHAGNRLRTMLASKP